MVVYMYMYCYPRSLSLYLIEKLNQDILNLLMNYPILKGIH